MGAVNGNTTDRLSSTELMITHAPMLRTDLLDLMFILLCFGLASLKSFPVIYFPIGIEMFTLYNCISEVHNFIFYIAEAQETGIRLCAWCTGGGGGGCSFR